ncbi:MAG TPA: hypothetical protein VGE29_08345, partial [Prosthecobacter sp.]
MMNPGLLLVWWIAQNMALLDDASGLFGGQAVVVIEDGMTFSSGAEAVKWWKQLGMADPGRPAFGRFATPKRGGRGHGGRDQTSA